LSLHQPGIFRWLKCSTSTYTFPVLLCCTAVVVLLSLSLLAAVSSDQRGENFVELSYIWNEWIDEITKFVCWARSIYFFLNLSLLKLQRSLFFNNLLTVFLVSTLKKSDLLHHFQKVTFFQSVCYSYSSKMSIHHCNDLTLIHYKAMMFL
jgi:hypothetical protein